MMSFSLLLYPIFHLPHNLDHTLTNFIDCIKVASGGFGGKGNAAPTQKIRGEKSIAKPPSGGEKRWLRLELKLVADIGLVGVPNAGKSTFLDADTDAKPKIASYAFTTIVPNLGVAITKLAPILG